MSKYPYESLPPEDAARSEFIPYVSSFRVRMETRNPASNSLPKGMIRLLSQPEDTTYEIWTKTPTKVLRGNWMNIEREVACDCFYCKEGLVAENQVMMNVMEVIGTTFKDPPFSKHRSKRLWKKLRRKTAKPLFEKRVIASRNLIGHLKAKVNDIRNAVV